MPIQSYDSLRHIVKLSKLEVPEDIFKIVEPLKGNDNAIQSYGIHQVIKIMFMKVRKVFSTTAAFNSIDAATSLSDKDELLVFPNLALQILYAHYIALHLSCDNY